MKKFKYDLTDEEDIEKLFFDTAKIFGIIFVILLIWSGFELLYFDKVNNYTKQLVLTADKKYENRKILGLSTDNITCSNVMNKNLHGFTEDELIYMEDVLNKKRKITAR